MEVLQLPNNAHMLETAGMLMYAMFYVFVVVVLLNALIAVMSQVYTEVEVSDVTIPRYNIVAGEYACNLNAFNKIKKPNPTSIC